MANSSHIPPRTNELIVYSNFAFGYSTPDEIGEYLVQWTHSHELKLVQVLLSFRFLSKSIRSTFHSFKNKPISTLCFEGGGV